MSDETTYEFTVRPVPGFDDVPPIIRLRRFLKAALRSYGLKCTNIRETTSNATSPATPTTKQP